MRRARRPRAPGNAEPPPPHPPSWLTAGARKCWDEIVPRLSERNLLPFVDVNVLARYCALWARWRRAEEFLEKHGDFLLDKDAGGRPKGLRPQPQVAIAAGLSEQLLRLEAQMLLTPAAWPHGWGWRARQH